MIPVIVLILAGLLVFAIRAHWVQWQLARYSYIASVYCTMNRLGVVTMDEMSMTWSPAQMIWGFWRWDFRAYVVYQNHYDVMQKWLADQLARTDLTLAQFVKECAPQEPAAVSPTDIHGQN